MNESSTPERITELREFIAKGLASAKAGKLKDGAAVISKLHDKLTNLERDRQRR